jgi:hypothetical protein
VYLEVLFDGGADKLDEIIGGILRAEIDVRALPLPDDAQIAYKYNEYIPRSLLRKQFAEDFLDAEGLKEALIY